MSSKFVNLYELLGVAHDASEETITKAFRNQARILHPDRNRDDPHAAEKFDAVKQARDTLLDPTERAVLDGKLRRRAEDDARDAAQTGERRAMREALRKRERDREESAQEAAMRAASAASMKHEAESALRAFKLRMAKVEHHQIPPPAAAADLQSAYHTGSLGLGASGLLDSEAAFEDASPAAQRTAIMAALQQAVAQEAAGVISAATRLFAPLPPGYPPLETGDSATAASSSASAVGSATTASLSSVASARGDG
jgi:curved DNA-binding protein CbpA